MPHEDPSTAAALVLDEAHHLRTWAATVTARYGEWECDYERWPAAYDAVRAVLALTTPDDWSDALTAALLYLVARDNECEVLAAMLRERPTQLLALASAALTHGEPDARWQLAVQLAELDPVEHPVEASLLRFARDPDEYVRRRTLMGLSAIGSSAVEDFADAAWATGDPYQRMAALTALSNVASRRLDAFLAAAEADGREHLVAHARRLRDAT